MTTIRRVEAFPLRLPADGPPPADRYVCDPQVRSIYPTRDELVLVRIATDDHVGWGEALTPVAPEAVAALVDHAIAPMLVGRHLDGPRPLTAAIQEAMRERGHLEGHHADAVAAVDLALWDLAGRCSGLPVATLLGGPRRAEIPLYLTSLPGADDDARAASARDAYEAGFHRMKVHLTSADPRSTLRSLDAVLAAVAEVEDPAEPARIAVDTHWVHDLGAAQLLADALGERGIWFLEAPLAPEDRHGHEQLQRLGRVTIAVGEQIRSRFTFAEWAARRAMGIAQPDICRTGISDASTVAALTAAHHIPLAPHLSMATGLGFAATLHVAAATELLAAVEFSPPLLTRGRDLLATMPLTPPASGTIHLPDGPGLGVVVDEAAVRSLAARFPA